MRYFNNGNVNSYYRVLDDEKSLVKFQYYNYLSVGMAILNTDKVVRKNETSSKKVMEASDNAIKKT